MKLATIVLAASLLAFALPSASADPCSADASAVGAGGVYVGLDGTLWQESNNVAGLQRSACEDDNGRDIPRDTSIL